MQADDFFSIVLPIKNFYDKWVVIVIARTDKINWTETYDFRFCKHIWIWFERFSYLTMELI